jgi:hypothetical protein
MPDYYDRNINLDGKRNFAAHFRLGTNSAYRAMLFGRRESGFAGHQIPFLKSSKRTAFGLLKTIA